MNVVHPQCALSWCTPVASTVGGIMALVIRMCKRQQERRNPRSSGVLVEVSTSFTGLFTVVVDTGTARRVGRVVIQ